MGALTPVVRVPDVLTPRESVIGGNSLACLCSLLKRQSSQAQTPHPTAYFLILLLLLSAGAASAPKQVAAQTPAETVFEMPGVFRIALPQDWQKTKVLDDRHTVAAFSTKDLTLEVMRDLSNTPAGEYAQTIPDRRLRYDADEYPGKYTPPDVFLTATGSDVAVKNRFDEYTLIGGLPAQWVRYRIEYTKPNEPLRVARVWTVFILSPGEYWSLELRGDDRSWPASDTDLRRMVRSFQFLEPMLTHVKTAIPPEAWQRMPSALSEGSCLFNGVSSGIGIVVPCDWNVEERAQGKPNEEGTVGWESLKSGSKVSLSLRHYVGNWSVEEFSQKQEHAFTDSIKSTKVDGQNESYQRTDRREVSVDAIPGTRISATVRLKKGHREGFRQLLTASKGTDHFSIWFFYTRDDLDEIDRIAGSVHLFALRPDLFAVSSPADAAGANAKFLCEAANGAAFFADEPIKPCPPTAHELERIREDVRLLGNSVSHYRLGKALDANGDHAGAVAQFEAAVLLNPRNAEADREVAEVYVPIDLAYGARMEWAKRGNVFGSSVPAAHDALNRAIAANERILAYSQDPNAEQIAHEDLATLYAQRGNTLLALFHHDCIGKDAQEVLRPQDEITTARKTLEDLTKQFDAAYAAKDENPTAENELRVAELSLKYGDFFVADVYCRSVHQKDPHIVKALACLAQIAEARGEHDAIVGYAQDWLGLSPDNPEAHFWLARGYSWEPTDYRKAAESYGAVIRNSTKAQIAPFMLQEAQYWWPYCYEQAQLWQDAANAYESNVRAFPADALVLNQAAWFFATTTSPLRSPARALEYANRAIAAAPADANIIDTLAEAYFINGRIDAAVATEQKALALAPDRDDLQKQMKKFKQAKQPKKAPPARPK